MLFSYHQDLVIQVLTAQTPPEIYEDVKGSPEAYCNTFQDILVKLCSSSRSLILIMAEEHEPSYYVNEGVDSFESGLWDGPGADEYDPYTHFDVDFDFEAAFGLTTSEPAGLEVPDQAAANVEHTQDARGAERKRDPSDSEAFPRGDLQQPHSGTENEAPADSLDSPPDPVRSLGHVDPPPTFSTPGEDSRCNSTSSSRRISHTTALPATQYQEQDAVQVSSSISDTAWPAHAQYLSSEHEDHPPAEEEEGVHDHEESSNF